MILYTTLALLLAATLTSRMIDTTLYLSKTWLSILTFTSLFTTYIVLLTTWRVFIYPHYYSPFRHLPTAKQDVWCKRLLKEPNVVVVQQYHLNTVHDGMFRYFGAFCQERVHVTDPALVKEWISNFPYHMRKAKVAQYLFRQYFGEGNLIVSPPEKHKVIRKKLTPAFKTPVIKNLYHDLWTQSCSFVNTLEKQTASQINKATRRFLIDVEPWTRRAALDMIGINAFGVQFDATTNPDGKLPKTYEEAAVIDDEVIRYYVLSMLLPYWLWKNLPVKARFRIENGLKGFKDLMLSLITVKDDRKTGTSKAETSHQKFDVISVMRRSNPSMLDEELLVHSMTILISGHDTTAHTSSFGIYLLGRSPRVQSLLRQEIRSNLPSPYDCTSSDHKVTATLLDSLPYLNATCNEILRLFPAFPEVSRQIALPGLTIAGTMFPVDSSISTSTYIMSRDPANWDSDPSEFKPERWLETDSENGKTRMRNSGGRTHEWAYLPFFAGPTNCIGREFAKGELLAIIAALTGRWEWEWTGGKGELEIKTNIVMSSKDGIWMEAKKVEGW